MNSSSNQSNKKKSSLEDRITGSGSSSFTSTLVKMGIVLIIASSAIVVYIYVAKPSGILPFTGLFDSTTEVIVLPADSIPLEEKAEERIAPAKDAMTIIMDDPNEPPYGVVGVISQYDKKLYTFAFPDGGSTGDDNDSTLTVSRIVEPGTNLSESLLIVAIRNGQCSVADEGEDAGTLTVGDIELRKSEMSDAGAGQFYNTFNYSFEKNGKCITFSLQLHSSNAMAFDPPVNEFDLSKEIKSMEDMLKTLKVY